MTLSSSNTTPELYRYLARTGSGNGQRLLMLLFLAEAFFLDDCFELVHQICFAPHLFLIRIPKGIGCKAGMMTR